MPWRTAELIVSVVGFHVSVNFHATDLARALSTALAADRGIGLIVFLQVAFQLRFVTSPLWLLSTIGPKRDTLRAL
ncbi:hypothetical protein SAMN05444000_1264 [Shimia gijangensis]|uniref:Uncharacterized protein n=1 Tax=Shimia gijangensis TaxID=1470563 RepID=A0A1M6RN43_9RHOB|nr:hypothetical protein SAMN05444000_1264 [Shimia gijangensis]